MRIVRAQPKIIRIVPAREALQPSTGTPGMKIMRWDYDADIGPQDCKSFTPVKTGDKVTDYQDVRIKGYLSTFGNFDRDGEFVEPGAFIETIQKFTKSPLVMLSDHRNTTANVVGSFDTIREDTKGLYVEGQLSNAQTQEMIGLRAKVAEGHIRTLSMGGRFYYRDDKRAIFKVDLFEGSIVSIPANPLAIFSTRSLTESELKEVSLAA